MKLTLLEIIGNAVQLLLLVVLPVVLVIKKVFPASTTLSELQEPELELEFSSSGAGLINHAKIGVTLPLVETTLLSFDNIEMMRQEQSLHQMLLFYPLIH
jgi:hypothetical protein